MQRDLLILLDGLQFEDIALSLANQVAHRHFDDLEVEGREETCLFLKRRAHELETNIRQDEEFAVPLMLE